MPTTPPDVRPTATGVFARTTITLVMAVIAALAFVFSFGNVWALALRLGIAHPIAPLIAPMVDLSVVGLLVALHHLAAHGTDPAHLRSATRLMHLCGLLTVALNTAEPLLARHYGRAALDTVAPALLSAGEPSAPLSCATSTHPPPRHRTRQAAPGRTRPPPRSRAHHSPGRHTPERQLPPSTQQSPYKPRATAPRAPLRANAPDARQRQPWTS